jgi:hypothetical protein
VKECGFSLLVPLILEASVGFLQRLADVQFACFKINIRPLIGQQLAASGSGCSRQQQERIKSCRLRGFEKSRKVRLLDDRGFFLFFAFGNLT